MHLCQCLAWAWSSLLNRQQTQAGKEGAVLHANDPIVIWQRLLQQSICSGCHDLFILSHLFDECERCCRMPQSRLRQVALVLVLLRARNAGAMDRTWAASGHPVLGQSHRAATTFIQVFHLEIPPPLPLSPSLVLPISFLLPHALREEQIHA